MKVTPSLASEIARTLLASHPTTALDVALSIVREVSRHNAITAAVTLARRKEPTVTLDTHSLVVSAVCVRFGVTELEVRSVSRLSRIVRPRQMIWALLHRRFGMPLEEIAHRYSKHHTTVMDGYKRVRLDSEDWLELNRRLDAISFVQPEAAE